MTSISTFVANMQAALQRWERAKTAEDKEQAEYEMACLIRGIRGRHPQPDYRAARAGERE